MTEQIWVVRGGLEPISSREESGLFSVGAAFGTKSEGMG